MLLAKLSTMPASKNLSFLTGYSLVYLQTEGCGIWMILPE